MQRFKERPPDLAVVLQAAKRRISDSAFTKLSDKELQIFAEKYLQNSQFQIPSSSGGQLISSQTIRSYLKDGKFLVNLLNAQTTALDEEIQFSNAEFAGGLIELQKEALAINGSITENEIKVYGNYSTVHFNAFVRAIDTGLGISDRIYSHDPKTGLTFLPEHQCGVIPGVGMTLPIRQELLAPMVDCYLVGEESDFGDTRAPLISTSAKNVFLPGKVFRHVIIRKEFDETTRRYLKGKSKISLMVVLGGVQQINKLALKPLGQSTLKLESISYLNETGEEIELSVLDVSIDTQTVLLFTPIRTKYLKVTVSQSAPVSKTQYTATEQTIEAINRTLAGAGFQSQFPQVSETLQGRVYDFSIEDISLSLVEYRPLGFFKAQPLEIKAPLGLTFSKSLSRLLESQVLISGPTPPLVPEQGLVETYIGVDLIDQLNTMAVHDLIPIPDALPIQSEIISLVGTVSKVKLFPDIRYSLTKKTIVQATELSGELLVELDSEHSLTVGDVVSFICPTGHLLNGDWTISTVVSGTEFTIMVPVVSDYLVGKDTLPISYLFRSSDQVVPFTFYKDNSALVLGTDFQLSLDAGVTWLNEYPQSGKYNSLYQTPQAGKFVLQILKPDYSGLYWIQYRVMPNQQLGNTGKVKLINSKVVFDKGLARTTGQLTTLLINRSAANNHYLTSILNHYSLKVREHVSK